MVRTDECPFCDSFDIAEITVRHFFCRDCGEKWIEEIMFPSVICETCGDRHDGFAHEDEFYDDEEALKYLKKEKDWEKEDRYTDSLTWKE